MKRLNVIVEIHTDPNNPALCAYDPESTPMAYSASPPKRGSKPTCPQLWFDGDGWPHCTMGAPHQAYGKLDTLERSEQCLAAEKEQNFVLKGPVLEG